MRVCVNDLHRCETRDIAVGRQL